MKHSCLAPKRDCANAHITSEAGQKTNGCKTPEYPSHGLPTQSLALVPALAARHP